VIEFIKTSGEPGKQNIPDGTIIYAHGKSDAMPVIDSIKSESMDPEVKNVVEQVLRSFFKQLELPEMKLAVGDHFKDKSPYEIPVGDIHMNINTITKYTLVKLSQDTAFLDIESDIKLKTDKIEMNGGKKMKLKVSGKGTGTLVYDPKNNFQIQQILYIDAVSEATVSEITVVATSNTTSIQSTRIAADNVSGGNE
jgi:hypothetical protein